MPKARTTLALAPPLFKSEAGTSTGAQASPPEVYERRVRYSAIVISKLNYREPRGPLTPEDEELVESIAQNGLVQNLIARPLPDDPDRFEVFGGGRRTRALGRLVDAGRWDVEAENIPIQVRVGISDLDLIILSLTENNKRAGTHYLMEARGVANAVRFMTNGAGPSRGDGITAELARRLQVSQRWVQILWQLDTELHPDVREFLLDHPQWSIEVAKAIRVVPGDLQLAAVPLMERAEVDAYAPVTAAVMREYLTARLPTVDSALFEVSAAQGGTTRPPIDEAPPSPRLPERREELPADAVVDEEETDFEDDDFEVEPEAEAPRFLDREEFARLQEAAIAAKAEELELSYPFVDIVRVEREWAGLYGHVRHDGPEAGAVLVVTPDLKVRIYTGYIRNETTTTKDTAKPPAPPLLKAHVLQAHHLKTQALQRHVGSSIHQAMRAAIPGLLGLGGVCRIGHSDIQLDDVTLDPDLAVTIKNLKPVLGGLLEFDSSESRMILPRLTFGGHDQTNKQAKLVEILASLSDQEIEGIFTALVAARTGSFAGYEQDLGDSLAVIASAQAWKVGPVPAPPLTEDVLQGYRKEYLCKVARACGVTESLEGKKAAAVRALILASPGKDDFYPPELTFANSRQIEDLLAQVGQPPKKKATSNKETVKTGKTKKPKA